MAQDGISCLAHAGAEVWSLILCGSLSTTGVWPFIGQKDIHWNSLPCLFPDTEVLLLLVSVFLLPVSTFYVFVSGSSLAAHNSRWSKTLVLGMGGYSIQTCAITLVAFTPWQKPHQDVFLRISGFFMMFSRRNGKQAHLFRNGIPFCFSILLVWFLMLWVFPMNSLPFLMFLFICFLIIFLPHLFPGSQILCGLCPEWMFPASPSYSHHFCVSSNWFSISICPWEWSFATSQLSQAALGGTLGLLGRRMGA